MPSLLIDTTGLSGGIYADPSRDLYHTLGLIENLDATPSAQQKPSYIVRSTIGNVLKSIWVRLTVVVESALPYARATNSQDALKTPQYIGKQGNISQLGGDFIFGPGESGTNATL